MGEKNNATSQLIFMSIYPQQSSCRLLLALMLKLLRRYFRTEVKLKDIEQIATDYAELDMIGVLLAWDAETATGLPPLGNDYIAEIVNRFPQQFIGFASVDPHKGKKAILEKSNVLLKNLGWQVQNFIQESRRFIPMIYTFIP